MPRTLVVLASLLCLPVAGAAQDKQPAPGPKGCPPVVVMAKAVSNGGKVELLLDVPHPYVEEHRKKVEVKEGNVTKEVDVVTIVQKSVMGRQTHVVDGNKVKVMRKNGSEVAPRDLLALLATSTAAVMFCGAADPFYLQVLRDDVLIIRLPEMEPIRVPPADKEFPKPPPKS